MINKLDASERSSLPSVLPDWRHDPQRDAISRDYLFADFTQAFAFMTEVAIAAEKRNHHPEWSNVYNRLAVTLTTHDANGLTQRDLELAQYMDAAFARYQGGK